MNHTTQFGTALFAAVFFAVLACVAWWANRRLRRVRRELTEGAERLALALAGADLGLWDWDVPSGRVTTNDRWLTMIGYAPGSVSPTYTLWSELIHPADRAQTEAVVRAHLQGDTPGYEAVFRMRHQDGSWVWIMARGKVMERDAKKQPLRVLGTHADVTRDKVAEAALQESEARAQALFRHLPVGAVVHAADTRVQAANPQACRLLGLTEAQMHGRAAIDPLWSLMTEEGDPLPLAQYPVNQVAASGQPLEGLLIGVHRPGEAEVIWVTCNGYPVRDSAGTLQQIVITFADVTAYKRAEAERRLLEVQLRESQKMESIGTLAGGIAHDFNNILGGILGNAGLARAALDSAHPAMAYLAQISRAGGRARELVQQILAFSRRQPQVLKKQTLRPLLEESVALLRATLPASVELDTQWAPDPVIVEADATQLQQVLVNLCTNAWHALQGGNGRIVVGLDTSSPDATGQPCAHIWVKDTGVGIEPTLLPRIFEPFFTTKPVGAGTGLGLSVVHGIVNAHHGTITVDSEVQRGSTFHVYLPLAGDTSAASGSESPAVENLPFAAGRGEHLVYVDDDETMALMVEELLHRSGYTVTTFCDPHQAWAYFKVHAQDIDLVVSDFNMPGMTGLELGRHLRRIRPELPLIIGSGFVSDELLAQMRELGVNAVLHKENTLEQLSGLVQYVLTSPGVSLDQPATAS
ncbi:MAG TPA: PAS domain-containing protein [Aquabacterium sp.]|nr:PAS domain-containing protein [Aquabacterium sp.]